MRKPIPRTINPRVMKPAPEQFSKEDGDIVTSRSLRWMHKEMYDRARSISREMGYSNVMWCGLGETDPFVRGFLLRDTTGQFDPNVIIGAATFRLRTYSDWPVPVYALQWIWICPKARRLGVLKSYWERFSTLFPDFGVEKPVSDAMAAFLSKHDPKRIVSF